MHSRTHKESVVKNRCSRDTKQTTGMWLVLLTCVCVYVCVWFTVRSLIWIFSSWGYSVDAAWMEGIAAAARVQQCGVQWVKSFWWQFQGTYGSHSSPRHWMAKTEHNYLSQLQFNNSIKLLARYQVSLATPSNWITDQKNREDNTRGGSRSRTTERLHTLIYSVRLDNTKTHTTPLPTHTDQRSGTPGLPAVRASAPLPRLGLWAHRPAANILKSQCCTAVLPLPTALTVIWKS